MDPNLNNFPPDQHEDLSNPNTDSNLEADADLKYTADNEVDAHLENVSGIEINIDNTDGPLPGPLIIPQLFIPSQRLLRQALQVGRCNKNYAPIHGSYLGDPRPPYTSIVHPTQSTALSCPDCPFGAPGHTVKPPMLLKHADWKRRLMGETEEERRRRMLKPFSEKRMIGGNSEVLMMRCQCPREDEAHWVEEGVWKQHMAVCAMFDVGMGRKEVKFD